MIAPPRRLPLAFLLLAACGDSTAGSAAQTGSSEPGTSGGSTGGCVGGGCSSGPTSGADDSTSTGIPTSGDASGTASSDDSTTGAPLACPFTPGCHQPAPLPDGVGRTSEVPLGCDGGSFTAAWSIGVGMTGLADPEAPRSIPLLADFDADGTLDLFVNMRKAAAAYVLHGLGDGSFDLDAPAVLSGGLFAGGWGGDAGDFNGDGVLDVLVGDHVRGAYAWTGPGFAAAITGFPDASNLFSGGGLADLDGDGKLDAIFGADQFGVGLRTFRGDGGGAWSEMAGPQSANAHNTGHFIFADLDADADLDVFAFGEGSGVALDVHVFRNDGDSFSEAAALAAGPPNQLNADPVQGGVGDINCDGTLDIAAGGSIYLGQGGSWSLAAMVDGSHIAHLADMNGDGHLDLVTHDPGTGLAVYLGDGSGTAWTPQATGLPDPTYTFNGVAMDTAYGIDVGDLDGDDSLDIVRLAGFGPEYALEAWVR